MKEGLWDVISKEVPLVPSEDWVQRDGKARATIGLLVEDNQLIYIKHLPNAKQYWKVFKELYEKPNLVNKVMLYKKIWKLYLGEKTMEKHISDILCVADELQALGEIIKDQMLIALLLGSLTEDYDSIICALEVRPDEDLTVNFVKEKLLQAYQRKAGSVANENNGKVLNVSEPKKKNCRLEKKKQSKEAKVVSMISTCQSAVEGQSNQSWFVDSGATGHMCNNKTALKNTKSNPTELIQVADGRYVKTTVSGNVCLGDIDLRKVSYVPELKSCLISVSTLTKNGYKLIFSGDFCKIFKDELEIASIKCKNGLYELQTGKSSYFTSNDTVVVDCIHTWHERLGHRHSADLKKMFEKGCLGGVKLKTNCDCPISDVCVTCCEGKLSRQKYPKKSLTKSLEILDLVHSDLCGPFDTLTPSGNRYILSLIDDFSRYCKIYFLKKKSEACSCIKEFVKFCQTQFQKTIKTLRSDRGGEYLSTELKVFLEANGIRHQLSATQCPQQNGVAERKNRYVVEMCRCLLFQSGLEKKYWAEAINTAVYIENRLGVKHNGHITPHEKWFGKKPILNYFKTFGSKAYVYDTNPQRKKLDKKCKELIFVGYSEESKAYRFLDVESDSIIVSRNAKFEESAILKKLKCPIKDNFVQYKLLTDNSSTPTVDEVINLEESDEEFEDAVQGDPFELVQDDPDILVEPPQMNNIVDAQQDLENPKRTSSRCNKGIPPDRFVACAAQKIVQEPRTYSEAMSSPEKEEWLKAMEEEVESINDNGTWDLVSLPPGRKAVSCKWVYKIKYGIDGQIARFKARLVAKGYTQKFGEDYNEVFAPVVKQTVFRSFLAVASMKQMDIFHIDVKNAFLNGELIDDIYMKQPSGFINNEEANKVYKLNKSLYGLKQSARCWNEKIHSSLIELGFRRGQADPCLYTKQVGEKFIFILLYVDDMLVSCEDSSLAEEVINQISKTFKITNLGKISSYLGVQVEKDQQGVYHINQKNYIEHILSEYSLMDCKVSNIPMDPGYLKNIPVDEEYLDNNNEYRRMIGSLLYLTINSRPDIAVQVSILSRKVSKPTKRDLTELRRVFKYLKATKDYKLKIGGIGELFLEGFADSDWAGDVESRKSTSGYVFKFADGLVSWGSRKQQNITLSSTEAEYVALSEACQELEYLLLIFQDLKISDIKVIMREDNQSCLKLLDDKINHRTRHIDVKYHYVKEVKNSGKAVFEYCQTNEMIADMLTKPLANSKLKYFCEKIGLSI